MKQIIFILISVCAACTLTHAQVGEIAMTGGMSVLAHENQKLNLPFGGGATLRMSGGKNNGLFSLSLGYDLNQKIEHPLIQRQGLQSLKTSIGAGGYALIGRNNNILFKALAEMVYWNSTLPSQQGLNWEGFSYKSNDIKGHSLGLQAHLGLSIPMGRESAWAFNVNTYAGGILRRQASYVYRQQYQGCCGNSSSQRIRRKFQNDPLSLPRAIVGIELGISVLLKPKEASWSRTTYFDPYVDPNHGNTNNQNNDSVDIPTDW